MIWFVRVIKWWNAEWRCFWALERVWWV